MSKPPPPQSPPWCPKGSSEPPLLHSHLLEAPHAVQDVKLLPALGKVHFAVNVIRVSQMDKGQVLQNQASERGKGAAGQGSRQTDTEVSHTANRQPNKLQQPPTATTMATLPRGKHSPAADPKVFRLKHPQLATLPQTNCSREGPWADVARCCLTPDVGQKARAELSSSC